MNTDPKVFWDRKILGWEKSRYKEESGNFLESVAGAQSSSLRFRMLKAFEILAPLIKDKHVLELGCGSGLLAQKIISAGATSYTGVDIAANAVNEGNNTIANTKAKLIQADVTNYRQDNADIIFSLGLTDWLTKEQIEKIFSNFPDAVFLHSFSEKRFSLARLIHKTYVYIAYGHKTGAYVPKYYSQKEMEDMCRINPARLQFIRDKKLSFGAFIFNPKQNG